MKTYTFEVVIQESSDEFWEEIENKTGCDDVLKAIEDCLNDQGWAPAVRLVSFKDE